MELNNELFKCRICESLESTNWTFKEMMFGLRHEFKYQECINCGCIQIKEYPQKIEKYYPENYYSFSNNNSNQNRLKNNFKEYKSLLLLYNHLVFKDIIGKFGKKTFAPFKSNFQYLGNSNLRPWSSILDVGSGNGEFLSNLWRMGFSNLTGIDKFIKNDLVLFKQVHIWKKEIDDLKKKFDFITMHHVFEHMPHQKNVLKSLHAKLNRNGTIIIRIPIVNKAWELYHENWVQLDAPRHFYLHTINSFKLLAENCGFKVTKIEFDSYSFQFWGSEQYKLNIPIRNDNRSYAENIHTSIFTNIQISHWEQKAMEFNSHQLGDQAIFFLKKNEQ